MQLPMTGQSFIDGEWVSGQAAEWERCSPSDESLVWQGCWSTHQQALDAVKAARRAGPDWAKTDLQQRIDLCRSFGRLVEERSDELAELIAIENGKPFWEAKTEVAASIAKVENSIEAINDRRWTQSQKIGDYRAVTRFRPHGLMFVIGPFNFPTHVPGGHIIPALLAGNTVIFKPSEYVPACGQWLASVWQEAGVPSGVFNLLHGAADVGNTLVDCQDVDGVLFTGSQQVGTQIHQRMGGQPHRVLALEMGGNNPLVVHQASDYRAAAVTTILSAFLTAGQRCTCTRRLIISGQISYDALVGELKHLMPQVKCGRSLEDPQPFMGPMIDAAAAERMLEAQQTLIEQGAKPLVTMRRQQSSKALLTPALLEIPPGQVVEDREFFGPLLMVHQAESLEHAIGMADATRYGLSAGFIGDRQQDFEAFVDGVHAGIVNWNRQTTGASGKLPFGGVGISGNHHPSGYFAADYCSYPIASLESQELGEGHKSFPGLDFQD